MNQIIIGDVPCPLCHAPRGTPCTRNGDAGCGSRIDYFMHAGSLDARIQVHLESQAYMEAIQLDRTLADPFLFVTKAEWEAYQERGRHES